MTAAYLTEPTRITPNMREVARCLMMAGDEGIWGGEISRISGHSVGSVAMILQRFDALGWIELVPIEGDKLKRKNYRPTELGEDMLGVMAWADKL